MMSGRQATALLACALSLVLCDGVSAQVAPETYVDNGLLETWISNGPSNFADVEVALFHGTVVDGKLVLGRPVEAIVSPAQFVLAPGSTQALRILLREDVRPGTVLRLVTLLTPKGAPPAPDSVSGPTARIVFATRLITRVVVRP